MNGSPLPCDVLVIGAGGAGLSAALRAAEAGAKVTVLSKVRPVESHTSAAKGGINASFPEDRDDHWHWHMYDTVRGGAWLVDQDSAERLCREAPQALLAMERLGAPFSRRPDGRLFRRVYGGQSRCYGAGPSPRRAVAAADRTGHAILHALHGEAIRLRVRTLFPCYALRLLRGEGGEACGCVYWDAEEGEVRSILASSVIIATGGFAYAWEVTTAANLCTGDGGALALRAGLPLRDPEFVQFHPTGLYPQGFLLSEAARAEGGVLRNGLGEAFMARYAPGYKDLAARDVVARAIAAEVAQGRGAGDDKGCALLDVTHLSEAEIRERLPAFADLCRRFAGKDPAKVPVPIYPSAHFTMGGIPTDKDARVLDGGGVPVAGLFAAGEAACASVHGANRLGCNGLLELLVFGRIAGEGALARSFAAPSAASMRAALDGVRLEEAYIGGLLNGDAQGGMAPAGQMKRLRGLMHKHAGLLRDEAGLQDGAAALRLGDLALEACPRDRSRLWNAELTEALELRHMKQVCAAVFAGALFRQESRGAHARTDFPESDDARFLAHTDVIRDASGFVSAAAAPVRMQACDPYYSLPPEARRY